MGRYKNCLILLILNFNLMKTDSKSKFEKDMSRANPGDPDYTNEFTETLLEEISEIPFDRGDYPDGFDPKLYDL
jgi:hypothetical protein